MNPKQVVIIGAPRSGTNMLRDLLGSFKGIATWPCDEINYIWRHGNVCYPSDEIPAGMATPVIKKYIQGRFDDIRKQYNADLIVEKTCANSLRVPFVDAVFPDAKYIFIFRDGIDSAGSAKLRWTANLDIPYLWAKAKFVPPSDMPYYIWHYLNSRLYRLLSKEKRLSSWGPKINELEVLLSKHSLVEVCALQWQRCVELAEKDFSSMPEDRLIRVKYEEFVREPISGLGRILDFIGTKVDKEALIKASKGVSASSIGKGRRNLGEKEVSKIENLIGPTLKRYQYV